MPITFSRLQLCGDSLTFVAFCRHSLLYSATRHQFVARLHGDVLVLALWCASTPSGLFTSLLSPHDSGCGPPARFAGSLLNSFWVPRTSCSSEERPRAKRTRAVLGAHASLFIGSPAVEESESPDLPPWFLPPRAVACYCRLQLLPVAGGGRLNAC
jgi:hypothetical protein